MLIGIYPCRHQLIDKHWLTISAIVDVREPAEYEAGYIPTALNLPITSQPRALLLDATEFREKYGFSKPPLASELVFYCKAGVRSSIAANTALEGGYTKVGEYKGSWLDWQKHGESDSNGPKETKG